MDIRQEIKRFLTTRRARVTPQMAGLPVTAGNRRVPGLRREEVALLAGVSVDYYTRLERGNLSGASREVLDALSQALLLDDAETQHLHDLARSASPSGQVRSHRSHQADSALRPGVQWILDSMPMPAAVHDATGSYLATNLMARALYSPLFVDPAPGLARNGSGRGSARPSMPRFMFLDERSRSFFPRWEQGAEDLVAMLRLAAGSNPGDPELTALVGELSTHSREFSVMWARHDVRYVCRADKLVHHPVVGQMHLVCESTAMTSSPGLTMVVYGVEPGSPSADAMRLLASWAASEVASATQPARDTHIAS
ncbi:XRE family transcriptional regulator [Actinomyces sp. 2119]|uniref:helix-turn-helix domain-containing protein n=1 Tax=Actinomyces sp. 2119 TaxID=2321393 RepID=UPI000E6CD9BB|nr:helix-turn-helix transcriptional regulator [Actinomyces sp. 2119]RJF44006.1 XRE family transcriptional regulator [Actinomyces sp. 2119]